MLNCIRTCELAITWPCALVQFTPPITARATVQQLTCCSPCLLWGSGTSELKGSQLSLSRTVSEPSNPIFSVTLTEVHPCRWTNARLMVSESSGSPMLWLGDKAAFSGEKVVAHIFSICKTQNKIHKQWGWERDAQKSQFWVSSELIA